MKKEYLQNNKNSFLGVFFVLSFLFIYSSQVYALVFQDYNSSNFNEGSYYNTTYNGSAVVLNGINTSGQFISRIFNAATNSRTLSINFSFDSPRPEYIFSIDASAGVYVSRNNTYNWTTQTGDYGGGGTNTNHLFSDDSFLYIIFSGTNKIIYKSSNLGKNWSSVNDSFTGSSIEIGASDSNNTLYVLRGNGEVWKSANRGISWSSVGDINPDSAAPKGIAINSSNALFSVDGDGEVWKSENAGQSWSQQNNSYGGGSGTDDMTIDSAGNLYILFNKAIYKSINQGVSWIIVNSSFTSYINDGSKITGDSAGNIYIADANGRVFASSNGGISWTERGDINGVSSSSNIKGLAVLSVSTILAFQARNCSLPACTDGTFAGPNGTESYYINSSLINITGQYFQYIANFSSLDEGLTPVLKNISLYYEFINTAPSISIASPGPGENFVINTSIPLNFSIIDNENNLNTCWYKLDNGQNISIVNCLNITFNASQGNHNLTMYANDTLGAVNQSNLTFFVDSLIPGITFSEPTETNNSYLTRNFIIINASASDTNFANITLRLFNSSNIINSTSSSNSSYFANFSGLSDGIYFFNASASDILGNYNITETRRTTIDTISPSISLISPDGTFGYNTSLSLNYSVSDANLQSCWYHIDSGANISILGCASTTFNTSEGGHILRIYSNDSAGNLGTSSKNFSITIGAPSITLHSPIDIILNSGSVQFNYTASDPDSLDYCELWGNFNGTFSSNQTTARQLFDQKFSLNLNDGAYIWNVWCIDMLGYSTFDGNKTFSVDTTAPSLTIASPVGSYTSQTGITLQYTANDNNNLSTCSYNVTKGASVEIASTFISGCANTIFSVSSVGDYVLWLSANDSVGNIKIVNSNFSIILPSGGGGGGSGGGGGGSSGSGGGSGGAGITPKKNISSVASVEFSDVGDIIVSPGEEKTLILEVKNNGTAFLNKCKLTGKANYETWVISDTVNNINSGEITEFPFTLKIPSNAQTNEIPEVALECLEISVRAPLSVRITAPSVQVTLSKILQLSNKEISVSYKAESKGITSPIIFFLIYDAEDKKISEKEETASLKEEQQIILDISNAKKGLLKIAVLEKGAEKPLVEEFFVYEGKKVITGFAFLDNLNPNNYFAAFIIVCFVIIASILIHRILQLRKVK